MFKKGLLILFCFLLLMGCSKKEDFDANKVTLDSNFYNKGEFVDIKSEYLIDENPTNYVLFVYNSYCTLKIPCEDIFKEYMKKENIDFLSMNIDEYKKTELYDKVKYAPTIIIVKDKKIVAYLDAESNEDLNKYQDVNEFKSWINKYINVKFK